MNFKSLVSQVQKLQDMNESSVRGLYTRSRQGFIVVLLLGLLVTFALYPILKAEIIVWCIVLYIIVLYRFYNRYLYMNSPEIFTFKVWSRRFFRQAIATAFLYSLLGFYFIHSLDFYYQLFMVTILLGLASGSIVTLSDDASLSIAYMSVILIPLNVVLFGLTEMPLHTMLAVTLFVYYVAQVTTIYSIFRQKQKIDALESQQTLLHNLFQNAPLGIFTYDKDLNVLDCNKALSRLFDYPSRETVIGINLNTLPDTRGLATLSSTLTDGPQAYNGIYKGLSGTDYWIESISFPFVDANNEVLGGVAIIEDKTKEQNAIKELRYLVEHDILTGLLNRRGFNIALKSLIEKPEHQTHYSILFYLDLDQFKSINDSMGHAVGDEVLLAVSKRLIQMLDTECTISRLGGDEFTVISSYVCEDQESIEAQAEKCSHNIENVFSEPYLIKEMYLHIKSSIGIVIIEPGASSAEEIVRHADLAMYQAKNSTEHLAYYDESLDKKQKDLFLLQHDLAYATYHDQLDLFFQPVVSMKDEKLLSAELLIRWMHPSRGLLSPEEFIPIAIKAGFLFEITWWIVDKTCQQISRWKKEGKWKLDHVSININATQFLEKNFAKTFLAKLKEYDVSTSEVMLEITERSLIDHFSRTQGVINDLRSYGIKCAIDDFGIGYSSLSYLKKLSFHTLKIDREFVKDIGQKPKELALMTLILEIGRQFDYNIIIEGIENELQKSLLFELDEDLSYQGYFFSKPLHIDEFEKKFLS